MAGPDREPLIWLWASSGRTRLRVPQAEPPDYQPACVSLKQRRRVTRRRRALSRLGPTDAGIVTSSKRPACRASAVGATARGALGSVTAIVLSPRKPTGYTAQRKSILHRNGRSIRWGHLTSTNSRNATAG